MTIKVKYKDYPESAESEVMVEGETFEVKAKHVREEEGVLILYNKKLVSRKEVEVVRFDLHSIDWYEGGA